MGPAIIVTTLTTVLFVGMILLLATKAKVAGRVTGAMIVTVAIGGLLIYGYGYSQVSENMALAVVRGILSVCGMFLGKNELSAIDAVPLMQQQWMLLIFWLLHLLAFYITAGAAIVSVGAEALKKLRLWLARRGKLHLIYGVNDESLDLGQQLIREKNSVVVYVDGKLSADKMNAVSSAGCAVRTDASAVNGSSRFLRAIGIRKGKRQLIIYALSKDSSANIGYARSLLKSLQELEIGPFRTRLVIMGQEDQAISQLQVSQEHYGYGFVTAVRESELAARLLIRSYPPCDHIGFDADARATEDFEALVVGFGQTGQAVLKQLVMNGQFEGGTFRAAVFAPNCQSVDGFFSSQFESLLAQYDISFYPSDARSRQMFAYLRHRGNRLKYVAVCTGNEKLNREIVEELCGYFLRAGICVPVYQCSRQGVWAYGPDGVVIRQHKLYTPEMLSKDGLDRMAMVLNHRYQNDSDRTPLENWMRCDYFSRQSCRAAADFTCAMLRAAGKTQEQALESWDLTAAQLLNLSKTEHHRWCAFHYCMGFSAMSEEEFEARAAEYRRQKEQSGKASIRIAKNMAGRTHACLVSWEQLVALSDKEAQVTGKWNDYQDADTQNVLAVPQLLQADRDGE